MLDVKNNFRGKYQDNICRGCGTTEETQTHILEECRGIHKNQGTKVQQHEIFCDDIKILKNAAKRIQRIEKHLS